MIDVCSKTLPFIMDQGRRGIFEVTKGRKSECLDLTRYGSRLKSPLRGLFAMRL